MLLALLEYIKKGQCVSLEQLSREFRVAEDALQPMLELWIHKKMIQPYYQTLKCASKCTSCQVSKLVYYQYIA